CPFTLSSYSTVCRPPVLPWARSGRAWGSVVNRPGSDQQCDKRQREATGSVLVIWHFEFATLNTNSCGFAWIGEATRAPDLVLGDRSRGPACGLGDRAGAQSRACGALPGRLLLHDRLSIRLA